MPEFPLSRNTLLAAVLLAVTLLVVYYQGVYRLFYDYYRNQYVEVRLLNFSTQVCETSENALVLTPATPYHPNLTALPSSTLEVAPREYSIVEEEGQQDKDSVCRWSLIMQIPKFVSYSAPGWIYLELRNEGNKPQSAALDINLSGEKLSLLPSMYKDDVFIRALERKQIAPGATLYGRMYFGGNQIVDLEQCNLAIRDAFYLNGEVISTETEGNLKCPENHIKKSLYRYLIENILLPPWANTIIPVLSLFVCFICDSYSGKKDTPSAESLLSTAGQVVSIYAYSLFIIFLAGFIFIRDMLQSLDTNVDFVNPDTRASAIWILNILLFTLSTAIIISAIPKIRTIWENRFEIRKSLADHLEQIRQWFAARFRKG